MQIFPLALRLMVYSHLYSTHMDFSQYPVTLLLIMANLAFSFFGFNDPSLVRKFIFWPYGVKRNQEYYRFISGGFLHADFMHLAFNMFTLFFFGRNLEMYFAYLELGGVVAYLALYFLGMIAADLTCYHKNQDNPHYHSLGASGAVSAVVFGTIIFSPWSSIYLWGALRISALVYAVLYVIYCIYMGKRGGDNINHDAHLWGSVFGAVFTILLVALLQPQLFGPILDELSRPSLFGRG